MSVLAELRAATASAHEGLEAELDVFRRLSERDAHIALMDAFHGLYEAAERALLPWLEDYADRLKAPILRRDLAALDAKPSLRFRQPSIRSASHALGFAYVLEGATLGGRVIHKRLRTIGHSLKGVGFFDAYGSDTGPRWQAFCAVLDQAEAAEAVAGACEGFAFMRAGLIPQAERQRRRA